MIYVLNLFRIALLTLGLYFYPEHKALMHDILFPIFIYGVVFYFGYIGLKIIKKESLKRIVNILVFLLGVIGFALIRFFETEIFYDPLIDFYDSKFFQKPFPELDIWLYNLNLLFRYVLNSAIITYFDLGEFSK